MQGKMLLLLCIVLAIWPIYIESATSESYPCPTWQYYSNSECVCGDRLNGAVICIANISTVSLARHFCIIFSEKLQATLVGSCPYSFGGAVPRNTSELKDFNGLCSFFHRRGQLCGACEENYTLSVYSYYLGCVKCENYKYGWLKFVTVAFLPLTIFYIIVILFRISATSSALNGYVLISQLVITPTTLYALNSKNVVIHHHHFSKFDQIVSLLIAIHGIWNLDFFRSFYKPICLHPDLKYQHVLLLDYAVAVYPLLLIFITFICVKLHDNFAIIVWLWRPFHKCLVRFRKQWNIRSYLVNALATFIVLSYVKILNVSFQFLTYTHVYNMKGKSVNEVFWYMDGRYNLISMEYLPYLVLALCMLLIFNVLPLMLLTLYPFRCFQSFLNICPCLKVKLALRIFMDAFHGCYKDTPHDYRHFAALYLAVRFLNPLVLTIFRADPSYIPLSLLILVLMLALVAKFQPYKCRRSNTVDFVMLLGLINVCIISIVQRAASLVFPRWLFTTVLSVLSFIPPVYLSYLLFTQSLPMVVQCLKQGRVCMLRIMDQFKTNIKGQPLLSHGSVNYCTFN